MLSQKQEPIKMEAEYSRLHKNPQLTFHVSYESAIFLTIWNIFSLPGVSYEQFVPRAKYTHLQVCGKIYFSRLFTQIYFPALHLKRSSQFIPIKLLNSTVGKNF